MAVAKHFGIRAFVCINKYDLNLDATKQIEEFCEKNNIPLVGKIPFDPAIIQALQQFKTPIEAGNNKVAEEIYKIWNSIVREIQRDGRN